MNREAESRDARVILSMETRKLRTKIPARMTCSEKMSAPPSTLL